MKKNWAIIVKKTYLADTSITESTDMKCAIPTKNDICQSHAALEDAYDHLIVEWIGVDDFILTLSERYTHATYINGESVVSEVLRAGLLAYSETLIDDHKHFAPNERLKLFISACIDTAKVIGDIKVIDTDKGEFWTATSEESLYEWGSNRDQLTILDNKSIPEVFASDLYMKIIPKNFRHAMRRFQHETAIMVGPVGHCA